MCRYRTNLAPRTQSYMGSLWITCSCQVRVKLAWNPIFRCICMELCQLCHNYIFCILYVHMYLFVFFFGFLIYDIDEQDNLFVAYLSICTTFWTHMVHMVSKCKSNMILLGTLLLSWFNVYQLLCFFFCIAAHTHKRPSRPVSPSLCSLLISLTWNLVTFWFFKWADWVTQKTLLQMTWPESTVSIYEYTGNN